MTDYPYITAWAVYMKLGPDWLTNATARAITDSAPADAWTWSVARQGWATLRDLEASAKAGNENAKRTHTALVTTARIISEDPAALPELQAYAEQEGIWQ
jgi:hypothetical protein